MDRKRALIERLTAWSPVLLLGSLAAFTYWLDAQVQTPPPRRDGSARHDPDLFLKDFRAINFDANGKPRESLVAEVAVHYPDDDSAELVKPAFTLTEPDKPLLTATAEKGRLSGDRENAYLMGNVVVRREAEVKSSGNEHPAGPVKVETEWLHVVPKLQKIDTDKPVTIEEARGIIHGTGLRFDNKAKKIELKSQVSGTFQPQALPK
jgi:lipopolysaccharide export system protein LptC